MTAKAFRDSKNVRKSMDCDKVLEKEMAIHSSVLAWKIPRTEEPGKLQSMGSQRVGHDKTQTPTEEK